MMISVPENNSKSINRKTHDSRLKTACGKCFHNVATAGVICLNPWGCDGAVPFEVVRVDVRADHDGVMHERAVGRRKTRKRLTTENTETTEKNF